MQKRFKFPKGVDTVYIPFMLTDIEPWQDQVKREMSEAKKRYGTSKSSYWGFSITRESSELVVKKVK